MVRSAMNSHATKVTLLGCLESVADYFQIDEEIST